MARKSTIDTSNLDAITIRMPKDLKEWIEKVAIDEHRSFNSQAVLLLQEIRSIKQPSTTLDPLTVAATGTVKPKE